LAQWLILIEEQEVVAALIDENGELNVGKARDWGGKDKDDLLAVMDACLGDCLSLSGKEEEEKLPAIFILSPYWVGEDGKILETRKQILKEVCSNLRLTPLGFLVDDEALATLYPDDFSVYLGENYFRIGAVTAGKVEKRAKIEKELDFGVDDIEEDLKKTNEEKMPEKVVIFGKVGDRKDERKEFKYLNWEDFFEELVKLVSEKKEGMEGAEGRESEEGEEKEKQKGTEEKEREEEEIKEDEEITVEEMPERKAFTESQDFGFSKEDAALSEEGKEETVFVDDIKQEEIGVEPEESKEALAEEEKEETIEQKKHFKFLLPKIPKIHLPRFRVKKIIIMPVVLIFTALLPFIFWFFSKAEVSLFLTPEEVTSEISVKLDPKAKISDLAKGIVAGEKVEVTVDGQKTVATTGEKLTGEKAKGEITIFNRTANGQTFKEGTILTGPGSLWFVLEADVKVASKTADLVSGVDRWGETVASISAQNFGAEYNLAAESVFTLEKFSKNDFLAKNQKAFSGGISRQVQAVSEKDRVNLLKSLSDEITEEGKKKLFAIVSNGKIMTESIKLELVSSEFDGKVGEEKDELTLELSAKVSALKLPEEEFLRIATEVLKGKGEGLVLDLTTVTTDFKLKEFKDGAAAGTLILKGKVRQAVDSKRIAESLVKKKRAAATEIVKNLPRVYRYRIRILPGIFDFLPYMPAQVGNIKIVISE